MNLPRFFFRRKNIQKSNFNNSTAHYDNCIASRFQQERLRKFVRAAALSHPMLLYRGRRVKILMNLPRKNLIGKILAKLLFSFVQLTTTLLRATKLELSLSLENSKKFCYNIYIKIRKGK